MTTTQQFPILLSALMLSLLAACGGGGGGSSGVSNDPIQEGSASIGVAASGQVQVQTTGSAMAQDKTRAPMQALLSSLQQQVAAADAASAAGAAPHAIVALRTPRLTWRESRSADPGFEIESVLASSGRARYPYLRYDDAGLAFSANKFAFTIDLSVSDLAQTMGQYLQQAASLRGAVGFAWEAETARLQVAAGDPRAGLTEEERAARLEMFGTGGAFKPIVVDLNGDRAASVLSAADSKVFFDWNDDGFLRRSGWIAPGDGLLVIDLNADATVTNSRELFSNVKVDDSLKSIAALRWLDANLDSVLDASDPAFAWLRVWVDDGNGIVDAGELKTMADLGITEIRIASQMAIRNGKGTALLSPTFDTSSQGGFRLALTDLGYKVTCTSGAQVFVTGLDLNSAVAQAVKYCGL